MCLSPRPNSSHPIIAIHHYFPSVAASFPNLKFIVFPSCSSSEIHLLSLLSLSLFYCSSFLTLLFFNSPFLTLSFTLVWCSPSSSAIFFQISFVVLPKFCCSPSTIILFYHAIADPRVFGSFCNIPLSLSTIVSFFSHNYVVFYSQLKCLHNALVLFPRILLSSSIRFCSSLTKLLFFYQYSIVFFHNAIVTILLSNFITLLLF